MIIHTDWIIRNRDQTIAIVSEKAMKIYNIIENGSDDHIKDVSVDETVISDEHQKLNCLENHFSHVYKNSSPFKKWCLMIFWRT